jgi:hypothetical protein
MTNHKLWTLNLAGATTKFIPVNTILKAKQNWYSKLQNHKPFFLIVKRSFYVFICIRSFKGSLLSQSVSAHGGAKKKITYRIELWQTCKKKHMGFEES